ncbi:MAG: methylenetetrahydrofolate reductase [NAD(P)H] [Geobacter sp.]|nr:methylenetetrahydrofolate reductase [NAD(P)H] [Geobacter sp.]
MRIIDLIHKQPKFISLEFFPPKERADWPAFFDVVERLKSVDPLFVSVTYGAGGSTQAFTLEIVSRMKNEYGLEPMAHLTCVGASVATIEEFVSHLLDAGVENLLALRGDPPQGERDFFSDAYDFCYAADLVQFVRQQHADIGIGVAGYPEGHPEAPCRTDDLRYLKEKLDHGGDFIVTQLFFDNTFYWDFVARAREAGIQKPIIPGVMPIFNLSLIKRITSLCGAHLPAVFIESLEEANATGGPPAVQALGIDYARRQVQDLLDSGAPGVHLYTLNKADACIELVEGLKRG